MKRFFLSTVSLLALILLAPTARSGPEQLESKATVSEATVSEDYNKIEIYGGYSHAEVESNVDTVTIDGNPPFDPRSNLGRDILLPNFQSFFSDRRGFDGFDTSITYNFTRYFGIKANVTGHYKSDKFVDSDPNEIPGLIFIDTINTDESIYNFLVGVQVKDNRKASRFKPFAHLLFGAALQTVTFVQTNPTLPADNFTNKDRVTSFAMKVGGGLDVRVHRNIDIRLIEVDYNPIFAGDRSLGGNAPVSINETGRTANNFTVGAGIVIHY